MSTQDLIQEMRRKNTGAAPPVQIRSRGNEFFGSLVWLYAKMITPLLLLTAATACGIIYWRLFVHEPQNWTSGMFTFAMLFIAINAIAMIFSKTDYDGFQGIELSREQAPAIWTEIDRISARASCPPISRLLIDNEFNASASTRKRKTVVGKRELEVTIGLPLLAALTPLECATVIAHEIGHHHGDDSRRLLAIRSAGIRASHIADMHQSDIWFMCLPTTFIFNLYLKILHRLSIDLSQRCEYDADAFAAAVCGVDACARADVAINVFADDVHEILWKPVSDAYENGTEIPGNIFEGLPERFSEVLKSDEFQQKMTDALSRETDPNATHPSMKDRLANIGAKPALPSFDPQTIAARAWLGDKHDDVVRELQSHWLEDFNREWGEQFRYKRDRRDWALRIFEGTEDTLANNPADVDAWYARCSVAGEIMDETDCKDLNDRALKACPDAPEIALYAAEHEVAGDDVQGVERFIQLIERAQGAVTDRAFGNLDNMARNYRHWNQSCPNIAELFENEELREMIEKLKEPAMNAHFAHYDWPEGAVLRAEFAPWQNAAIEDFCRYFDGIERLWVFKKTEPAEPTRYFLVANYRNSVIEEEESEVFDDFDPADIPLRGVVGRATTSCGSGPIKGILARGAIPRDIAKLINQTEPHFIQGRQSSRLSAGEKTSFGGIVAEAA